MEFSFFSLHVFKMSSKKIRVLKATLEMVAVVLNALCCLLCLLLLGSSRSLMLAGCLLLSDGCGGSSWVRREPGGIHGCHLRGWGCPSELLLLPAATGGVLQREGVLGALVFATHLCSAGRELGGWCTKLCPRGVWFMAEEPSETPGVA